jgi:nitroreductase
VGWAKEAPVLMLSVAQIVRSNGKANRHGFHDVGQATAYMTLQALSEGIYLHQMGGFYVDKARELYQIPEDFEPVAAIALGYLGQPEQLDEKMCERELEPRTRDPLADILFGATWGEKSPLISS